MTKRQTKPAKSKEQYLVKREDFDDMMRKALGVPPISNKPIKKSETTKMRKGLPGK